MGLIAFITHLSELGRIEAKLHRVRNHLGRARRPGGFGGSGPPGVSLSAGDDNISRVRLDRSKKTPSNQLIQPGRSNICHQNARAAPFSRASSTAQFATPATSAQLTGRATC